jgi:CRISPR-associated protein Cas2
LLVTYDVNTTTPAGRKRLRRAARACQDFGQRVQFSVFEIEVDPGRWVTLKARLEGMIDVSVDNLRYYDLGANRTRRVEHVGAKPPADLGGPLIV